jgi:trk system potassium uptake protein TrkH
MNKFQKWLQSYQTNNKSVVKLLIFGYFILTLLCFGLLILPFSQNEGTTLVNQIFFSASIVSTTGLAPADFTTTYNLFGQVVSLFFIQLGGIGYMALSSFIILRQPTRMPKLSARLLRLEFNLPQKYPLLEFTYSVFIFTIIIEIIGTIFLYIGFVQEGVANPLWNAVFHSISAFCTAGFSLFGDSMTSFRDNNLITTTILVLSLLGSIGFIVLLDYWNKFRGKRKNITLTSKIILLTTFALWIAAAIFIYISDIGLRNAGWEGMEIAIFQSISAHTTVGFNNGDIGSFGLASTFVMIILMIVGASPAGTGGGIKTTSISAILAVLNSILHRRKHITFLGKEIPPANIYLAISSAMFYSIILIIGAWIVLLTDGYQFGLSEILFESASALSTVGLSTGITADLSNLGKLAIAFLMFIGRLGVLTFGFALISKSPLMGMKPKIEDIAI